MTDVDPDALMADLRVALAADTVRFETGIVIGTTGSAEAIHITTKRWSERRWTKFRMPLIADKDQTIADLLHMLGTIRTEVLAERYAEEAKA